MQYLTKAAASNLVLILTVALVGGGCALNSKFQRKVASEELSSPFISEAKSRSQTVDAVIERLGPARDQQNTQLCVANATADVVTFFSGKKVSAFSVAVRNFQKRKGLDYIFLNPGGVVVSQVGPDSRYMLGLASSALQSSLNTNLCLDDQPLADLTYRDRDLKELWDSYSNFRAYVGPTAPIDEFEKIEQQLAVILPSLNSEVFIQNLSPYKPLDHALGEWFDQQCTVKIPESLKLEVVGSELGSMSGDQVVTALDQALEAGSIALVHYDVGVLDGLDPNFLQSVIGFHVSSIVAKSRTVGGKLYLLRNSWGESCFKYAAAIAKRCDRGHIWLTEKEVRTYVSSVAYYQKK